MDKPEALLKEYEVCAQENTEFGHDFWVSTTICMTVNVTLWSGLVYGTITSGLISQLVSEKDTNILSQVIPLGAIVLLGIGIIFILKLWMRWLGRIAFLAAVNYERMRNIEKVLGMKKNWLAYGLDLKYGQGISTVDSFEHLPESLKKELERLDKNVKYLPPAVRVGRKMIGRIMVGFWAVIILLSLTGIMLALS